MREDYEESRLTARSKAEGKNGEWKKRMEGKL